MEIGITRIVIQKEFMNMRFKVFFIVLSTNKRMNFLVKL